MARALLGTLKTFSRLALQELALLKLVSSRNCSYSIRNYLNWLHSDIMLLLLTPSHAQRKLADHVRARRLALDLTQEGLATRSGVPLATLRKFEQKGTISLEAFLKLLMVVGGMEDMVDALEPQASPFSSIDDVLKADKAQPARKRGRRS
jgi:hypothetical protein